MDEEIGRITKSFVIESQLSDEEITFYDIISMGKEFVESNKIAQEIAVEVTDYIKKNTKVD